MDLDVFRQLTTTINYYNMMASCFIAFLLVCFGWTQGFLLAVWCHWGEIELAWERLAECDQPKENTPPRPGIEPRPRRGQTMKYIHFFTELSWLVLFKARVSIRRICPQSWGKNHISPLPHFNMGSDANSKQLQLPVTVNLCVSSFKFLNKIIIVIELNRTVNLNCLQEFKWMSWSFSMC